MKETLTTCPYCGCGCCFVLREDNGSLMATAPVGQHPVSCGSLCVKGWNAHEFVQSPERLHSPMVRLTKAGQGVAVDWDTALNTAADRLRKVIDEHGPDSVGVFSSAKCTNEENFLLSKFARAVVGTNNVDHCARLCHASTVLGLVDTFGSGAMTNSIEELVDCDCIFVIGSNTTDQHPQVAARILTAVRKGCKLIVADPRKIRLTRFATHHVQQQPGSDVALINAMCHVILAEGLEDRDFIAQRTEEFEAFREVVQRWSPDKAEALSGVAAEDIVAMARTYGQADRGSIIYSMGITQHSHGVDNVRTLANLAMLTGNVGRASTGVNPLRGQNNVQGACDMGALPNVYSGYQKVDDPAVRGKFSAAWGRELPAGKGMTLTEMIHAADEGKIKALYVVGENPMISDPDITTVERALGKLDVLIVQDIFRTETAELADILLPAASYAEKEGTFTNTERRVQRVREAIDPVPDSRADWRIICDLAARLGADESFRYDSPSEIFEEIARLTPIYGGMSHERLDEGWGLCWPCPTADHPGTPYLHKNKFSRGLGRFRGVEYRPPAETVCEEYPLVLTTGRIYFHWHTGHMTRRTSPLHREEPVAFVEISPEDAKPMGIWDAEKIRVSTRRGSIELAARLTRDVAPGVLFIPFHFYEAAANVLTNPALDPEAKIPEFKVAAARVEKISKD